ncbi:MAG: hypothetical protein LUF85_08605 [Bacteroides sp.]|nr:hypothetical protein [Bacteroides sp.]
MAETIVIKAARQRFGKSSFTKAELIRFALYREGTLNAYVTPKLSLAKKMFKEIIKATSSFIVSRNQVDMSIEYSNGSIIRFHSEQQGEGLRGFTVTGLLVIDEGSSFKDTTFYEFIAPWVTVHKALTIITSTPKYKTGFFYESYMEGIGKKNPYYTTFDWVQSYEVPISLEDQEKRDKMPSMKWRSEYEGFFLDAEGSVFGNISACLIDKPEEMREIYLGLDFGTGSGKDYTVLTGFNQSGQQVFIWSTNDMAPLDQVEEITKIVKSFQVEIEVVNSSGRKSKQRIDYVKGFYAEENSIGKIYLDALKKQGVVISPFNTTAKTKRRLIENFQVAIQNSSVGLLKDQDLMQQFSLYESQVDPKTNKVTYNAPAGMNDDKVIATLLAWNAYLRKITKMYNIR